nr:MAG TPA: hypothetical protein [Caudoviricetes sp.]
MLVKSHSKNGLQASFYHSFAYMITLAGCHKKKVKRTK